MVSGASGWTSGIGGEESGKAGAGRASMVLGATASSGAGRSSSINSRANVFGREGGTSGCRNKARNASCTSRAPARPTVRSRVRVRIAGAVKRKFERAPFLKKMPPAGGPGAKCALMREERPGGDEPGLQRRRGLEASGGAVPAAQGRLHRYNYAQMPQVSIKFGVRPDYLILRVTFAFLPHSSGRKSAGSARA